MARLIVELLNSGELAELAIGGAWNILRNLITQRFATLGSLFLEMDICRLAMAHLQMIGSAADWVVSGN